MSKASPRSRTALARALLLLVSLLVVLGLAEGAARLSWNEKERRPAPAEYDASLPRIKGLRALAAPHVRGVHKGVLYRTNSRAIRGPEYAERPPAGVFRVAITGDSVTMGWGVEEAEAYPALLEQGLSAHPVAPEAPDARRSYQVLNFGLAGLNADGAVSRLIKKSAYYRPSLVVYGFTVNDIEGPHFRRSDPQTDESPGNQSLANRYRAQRFSPSYLLRILWPNWVALQEMWSPTPGTHQAALLENYFENPAAFAALDAALGRLAAHAEEQGICAHVLVHTQLSQLCRRAGRRPSRPRGDDDRVALRPGQRGRLLGQLLGRAPQRGRPPRARRGARRGAAGPAGGMLAGVSWPACRSRAALKGPPGTRECHPLSCVHSSARIAFRV
jgi:lysophospholipase L1-like esterase